MLETVDDTTFKKEISGDLPVLVDFWAPWCGPCRIIHPILEEIAKEEDGVRILSLNVDENNKTAREFAVQSIPTMILFRSGQEKLRIIGAQPKKKIIDQLRSVI